MLRTVRRRLQQQASIRVDQGGAPPMNPVPFVERGLPALPAFRLDDRMSKFDLTHFQNAGAGRGLERRPCSQAKAKTKAIRPAGNRTEPGQPESSRGID